MRFFLLNFAFLFVFSSCANNSDEKLLNDRISVLSYAPDLLVSSNLSSEEIKLSQAKELIYWSQSGQNPKNNLPHILSSVKFENKEKR